VGRIGMLIDLHTHTFFSDGDLSPAELIRRAETQGYSVLALTDHVDASNMDLVLGSLLSFHRETQPYLKVKVLIGVELTHIPPAQVPALVRRARSLGAHLVILHGETISEPVEPGTNRAGIEAGVDILAHPGLITAEEIQLAAKRGVALEISARPYHAYGNGRLLSLARKTNVCLVLNSDTHSPEDLLTQATRDKVAFGAGMEQNELTQMIERTVSLVQGFVQTTTIV